MLLKNIIKLVKIAVAPLAGAWIEIDCYDASSSEFCVAPLAGAWIEIRTSEEGNGHPRVAPLAGAWIEMLR